jgi:elongation factor P--beta-lysine ligase
MKRGKFLKITSIAVLAFYLPGLQCHEKNQVFIKLLAKPLELQQLCDVVTIKQIGRGYMKQFSDESNEDKLVKLLSLDHKGGLISDSSDSAAVSTLLQQKIEQDFRQNKVVVVNGWVLAQTEARQCALLSIIEK